MAMKKSDMEDHYNSYLNVMEFTKQLLNQGLYAEALKQAIKACDHVDGMMKYARKYQEEEFDSIEAIDFVFKYAPLLFDNESLKIIENLINANKQIEKNTSICIADQLSKSRNIMSLAHQLWNYLEDNPHAVQNQIANIFKIKKDVLLNIVESWECMGLLDRKEEGSFCRLNLKTRMDALTRGKCPRCGSIQKAPKAILLEPTKCPDCHKEVSFVILHL